MANPAVSYNVIGNREDLTDVLQITSRTEAPIYNACGVGKPAKGKYHEWQLDSLAAPASNAHAEGAVFSGGTYQARVREGNWVQIFKAEPWVSLTQEAISKAGGTAGVKSEYSRWVMKSMKEIARDIDLAFITGTGNSGASGTASELKGMLAFITGNVVSGTSTATRYITEDNLNECLQSIWENGGTADTIWAGGFQKRKISGFTTSNQRTAETKGKKLFNRIDIYESDFGVVKVRLEPVLNLSNPDTVIVATMADFKKSFLRRVKHTPLAQDGDRKRGLIVGELTMESRAYIHSGKITLLKTS